MQESTDQPKRKINFSSIGTSLVNKVKEKSRLTYPVFIGLTIILAIIVLYIIVVGVGLYAFNWRYNFVKKTAAVVPYPAGWVNVFPIRFGEVFNEEEPAKKFYKQTGSPIPAENLLEKQAMEFLVRVKIVQEYAGLYRVSVPIKDINDALNKLYEENGGKQSFEQILNQYYGYTPKDIYRLVYLSLMQQKLNDYYDKEIVKQIQLSQILLDNEDKANKILAQTKKGDDFEKLAKSNSLDKNTKDKGGDLGYFKKDDLYKIIIKGDAVDKTLLADVQKKLWAGKKGDVFLFKTDLGWQVIKVAGFLGSEERAFDEWLQEKTTKGFILKFI